MGKIIQLDEVLSNKIAAGEVVERPASVVKELVENSIDANSTVIEVEVTDAGLEKIRVIDNGDGMEQDDVILAFERHATSKIKDENDLFRIHTLGFRGEALPSIASVSRMELITSTGTGPGTRLVLEGGSRTSLEAAQSRKGTEIVVSGLFYNTPARLKYMKSIQTELGNITDIMNRLALAHPGIAMKLIHNGRKLLQTAGNGDVRQVLAAIYGLNTAKKMIPIMNESLDFKVSGYIALPEINRASRNYISTMINGRFVKNYALNHAILNGYHTLLPIGRYPICFVHISMDPILVDVNVHPAKLEVRISKEQQLGELVTETIKKAFRRETLIPAGVQAKTEKKRSEQLDFKLDHLPNYPAPKKDRSMLTKREREIAKELVDMGRKPEISTGKIPPKNDPDVNCERDEHFPEDEKKNDQLFSRDETIRRPVSNEEYNAEQKGASSVVMEPNDGKKDRIPPLYPIGQLHGTYILAENEQGLYIIDQHAAQERIKYEYFRDKLGQVENELQELLIPITLQFSNDEYIKLEEHMEDLRQVGVFLEPFGNQTFIVRNHPQWFPKGEEEETIREIIDQVLTMKKADIGKLREESAIMMSCKGSIKANHRLQKSEIQNLLDLLRTATDPFTCPHGRPIIIHYSTYELEKMFKRVM